MLYGYARVSTAGQAAKGNSLEDQLELLKNAGCSESNIFLESYTGTKMERPVFNSLLGKLQTGDTLVVTKLDRFARNADDGGKQIKDLLDRGISVHVLNMGLIDNTPMGKLIMHVVLAFAEFERDMIVERTQAGKAIARQKPGYHEGRNSKYGKKEIEAIRSGASWDDLGMSRSTWYRLKGKVDTEERNV